MTAPTPGTRADSDPLAAANRWLDRHGDTITHRGRACSVLNDQELAELVHATVATAYDQARAEVVALTARAEAAEAKVAAVEALATLCADFKRRATPADLRAVLDGKGTP